MPTNHICTIRIALCPLCPKTWMIYLSCFSVKRTIQSAAAESPSDLWDRPRCDGHDQPECHSGISPQLIWKCWEDIWNLGSVNCEDQGIRKIYNHHISEFKKKLGITKHCMVFFGVCLHSPRWILSHPFGGCAGCRPSIGWPWESDRESSRNPVN